MSAPTDSNATAPAASGTVQLPTMPRQLNALERALAAAIQDATKIGDLLDALRSARLWLPLPAPGGPSPAPAASAAGTDGAVTLPTVVYLGCDFIPGYTSAEMLRRLAGGVPHLAVRATDLARLLPPDVGIALNAGAEQSVPVYPQGVAFLAADEPADARRVTVGPLPVQPGQLLALIRTGLTAIPQAREASAGWLSVQLAGEGMIISVTLDDPADAAAREQVIAALERAAAAAPHDARYPIDVTFPGEGEPDHIDHWMATGTTPFYVRS